MKLIYTGTKPYTCPHGIRTFYPGQTYEGVPRPLGELIIREKLGREVRDTAPAKRGKGKAAEADKQTGPEEDKATGPEETK